MLQCCCESVYNFTASELAFPHNLRVSASYSDMEVPGSNPTGGKNRFHSNASPFLAFSHL